MLKHKLKKTTEKMYFGRKSGEKKKSNSKENLYAKVRKSHNTSVNQSRGDRSFLDGGYFTGPESFYDSPEHQRASEESNKALRNQQENIIDHRGLKESSNRNKSSSRDKCDHNRDCHHHYSRGECGDHYHHDHNNTRSKEADLDFNNVDTSLGYSSGEFSSGSFQFDNNKSSNTTKVRGETVDHRRQPQTKQQKSANSSSYQQKSNQPHSYSSQKSYQGQKTGKQQKLFANQLPQPAPVVVPIQVLWNRRASPQEDFLYTAQGIQELVRQQNKIVNDLKRSLEATVINEKIKAQRKTQQKTGQNFTTYTINPNLQEPSSMAKIRRLLEIEEMSSFSRKLNQKLTKPV